MFLKRNRKRASFQAEEEVSPVRNFTDARDVGVGSWTCSGVKWIRPNIFSGIPVGPVRHNRDADFISVGAIPGRYLLLLRKK